jgi:hypothetical protein
MADSKDQPEGWTMPKNPEAPLPVIPSYSSANSELGQAAVNKNPKLNTCLIDDYPYIFNT